MNVIAAIIIYLGLCVISGSIDHLVIAIEKQKAVTTSEHH